MSAAIWLQCEAKAIITDVGVHVVDSSLLNMRRSWEVQTHSVEHLSAIVFRLCCEATATAIRIV